jgi:hypothetical protein
MQRRGSKTAPNRLRSEHPLIMALYAAGMIAADPLVPALLAIFIHGGGHATFCQNAARNGQELRRRFRSLTMRGQT